MFTLRNYQQEGCDIGLRFLQTKSKKRGLIVAPTASGKSLYTAYIAKELVASHPTEGVLVMQPTKELLEQNYAKYVGYGGEASVYSASMGIKEVGLVTYATIGSVKDCAHMFQHVRYVIIDECHRVPPETGSMYMKFLKQLHPDVMVLGLTATPFRMKTYNDPFNVGKKFTKINLLPRERPLFFNEFLHITQISELYDLGFLAPLKYIAMKYDGRFLEYNSTGAEFTEASMIRTAEANDIFGKIPKMLADAYRKDRKHCLVFVQSVADAKALAQIVPFSNYVEANTKPKERDRIIADFKNGNIKTLFNVSVLTEGFDFPALDTIILARPTNSLGLYMQMIGRGIRVHPDKAYCALVDMCGNIQRFGRIENMKIEFDERLGWCLHNSEGKILTGVRLDPDRDESVDLDDW